MRKNRSLYLVGTFSVLTILMMVGLMTNVISASPDHASSMIIGTLSYVAMAGLVLATQFKNKHLTIATGLTGLGFAGVHIFTAFATDVQFSRLGLSAGSNLFGTLAIGAFVLAGIVYGLSKLQDRPALMLTVNGLMTAGVSLTYYHVATMDAVRGSMLFFIPFTAIFFWTVGQFAKLVIGSVKAQRQLA